MENQNSQIQTPKPSNHLGGAIVATLLCCMPFGIPAIVYAAKVDALWYAGEKLAAIDAAGKARTWMIVSMVMGILFWVIYVATIYIASLSVVNEIMNSEVMLLLDALS